MTMKLAPPPPPHLLRAPPPPAHLLRAPPPPPHLLHDHSLTVIVRTMDTECYRNYWLIKFYNAATGETVAFEQFPGQELDVAGVRRELQRGTIVTFNGNHYDLPMVALALAGADCNQLKEANDLIIKGGLKPWDFYKHFRLDEMTWMDHIDVKEVAPGVNVSLKTYGGRNHSRRLQELPIEPSALITPEQRVLLSMYCTNDLITTWELYQKCIKAIELRVRMTAKYGVDLRSKSDAQIAESLFKQMLGFKVNKPFWPHMTPFSYTAPDFIKFVTPHMQDVLQNIHALTFYSTDKDQLEDEVDDNGDKVKTGIKRPDWLKKLKINIGESFYKLGIGGLHSMESAKYHISGPQYKLSDHDVNSYYPSLILICDMFPVQLGQRFLDIYRELYEERLAAKALGGKIKKAIEQAKVDGVLTGLSQLEEDYIVAMAEADAKKIVLNGTFGKLGSKYSIFFAPDLLLRVTLTGQLALLMLIESLELSGIPVVSANTDGIVIKCPVGMEWLRDNLIKSWEANTGLTTEANEYAALYSRDINNYLAFKYDGTYKAKGIFAKAGIAKNPTNSIVVEAVADYLGKSKPLQHTINECQDVTKFLTIRNVKGGGVKEVRGPVPIHHSMEQLVTMAGYVEQFEGWEHNQKPDEYITLKEAYAAALLTTRPVLQRDYLGKVVRWYYGSADKENFISYASNGNKVPKSEGAVPLMDLPDSFPVDLDRARYVQEACDMLATLGVDVPVT